MNEVKQRMLSSTDDKNTCGANGARQVASTAEKSSRTSATLCKNARVVFGLLDKRKEVHDVG